MAKRNKLLCVFTDGEYAAKNTLKVSNTSSSARSRNLNAITTFCLT
jgi:hypothetical protein